MQQGLYILFPNDIIEENGVVFWNRISPIKKDNKVVQKRIIIPNGLKCQLRKNLETLGISEYTLFSDNIDVVCKGILSECKKIMR